MEKRGKCSRTVRMPWLSTTCMPRRKEEVSGPDIEMVSFSFSFLAFFEILHVPNFIFFFTILGRCCVPRTTTKMKKGQEDGEKREGDERKGGGIERSGGKAKEERKRRLFALQVQLKLRRFSFRSPFG